MLLRLKKGIDLKLSGGIVNPEPKIASVSRVALTPADFPGMIPKPEVKPGDHVIAGTPIWHDKNNDNIKVVSPVAGTIKEIERGEKRRIIRITIDVDQSQNATEPNNSNTDKSVDIKGTIQKAGLWAMMRQLPYDIVPVDNHTPANIFISAWDAAPLAAGFDSYLDGAKLQYLQKGVTALASLTSGKVYIGIKAGTQLPPIENAEIVDIEGNYPASLPSVLAANVAPVNKGETVWLLSVETAVRIGQAIEGTAVDWNLPVAVVGSEIETPSIVKAPAGASVADILEVAPLKCCNHHIRLISGNVFVGEKVLPDEYLRYPYRQLTAIPEGDDRNEFMGWASFSPDKLSKNRSFPSFFFRSKKFSPDARLNGGRRAMIMSGEYDRYIPMDIMAEYLIKAILARDIERMEALGIYEVTPGDFSAAEYADTSKLELQKIVREGLDYMIKELGTEE